MSTLIALMILIAPFAVAAGLGLVAHRTGIFRFSGRYSVDDRDALRIDHDVDAIRTRFEQHPFWPTSGSLSEGR